MTALPLPPRDLALAAVVVLAWGTNFTAMKIALEELPPFLFVALRFAILLPLLAVLPRPAVSWGTILAVGALINMGQFALLFSGMEAGVSAGLGSLLIQAQVPFTVLLSALILGEHVRPVQIAGIMLAMVGLGLFALGSDGNVTRLGLMLVVSGALCWACGNLVLKRLEGVHMLALFVWASLIPPVPMLALSLAVESPGPLAAIGALSPGGWAAVAYVAVISTVLGYSLWGFLMSRHPAAVVTPFALLIPVVGIATSAMVLGERLTGIEIIGAGIVMAGLTVTLLGPAFQTRSAR